DRSQHVICTGAQKALVLINLVLGSTRRHADVSVGGFHCVQGHFRPLVQTLILIQVGLSRTFRQNLGHAHQSLGIVGIELEHLSAHFHHLVGIVGGLIVV